MDKAALIEAIKNLTPEEAKDVKKALGVDEQTSKIEYGSRNKEQLEHAKKLNMHLAETADLLNQHGEASRQRLAFLENEIELLAQDHAQREQIIEAMKQVREYGDKALDSLDFENEAIKEKLKLLAQEASTQRGLKEFGSNQRSVTKEIASNIGLRINYNDTLIGQSAKLIKNLNAEGQAGIDAKNAMIAVFKETFNLTNLATNIFTAIKDNSVALFKAFDKAQASLAAATGQGREFNDVLYEVGRSTNLYGISMDEAGKAIGVLVNQTSYFTSLNKATQMEVAKTTAQMERLGVSTADSAAIFQNFNQGLGMTANQSIKMQRDLAMAGVDVGISAEKITKDFNASLGTLMVYGRESINVFKGIAAAAKAAGVETSTLLGIASKFDTFAGAAEGAGKLNALLGTQLSTTEMLMATEDERIRMLVESVQAQGVAFQDMDRFTQKAIANSVGITDMAEANRIFGMSLKEYDENERKLKASADAQKKFEDAVAATVPVMDKFKLLGAEMVIALEPVFEFLSEAADGITKFLRDMDTETKSWAVGIAAALSGIVMIAPIFMAGGGLIAGLSVIPAMITAVGTAMTGVIGAISSAIIATGGVGGGVLLGLIAAGGVIGATMAAMSEASAKTAEAEASAAKSKSESVKALASLGETSSGTLDNLDRIANADFSKAISGMKAIVGEAASLSNDLKITSTIENLALITAGQAKDMSGNVITASAVNITNKVENIFSGMKMTLLVEGRELEGVVAEYNAGHVEGTL